MVQSIREKCRILKNSSCLALLAFIIMILLVYMLLRSTNLLQLLNDSQQLQQLVAQAGILSGLVIIGLLAMAIVVSPVPSAPIAVVAGMLYGHILGTIYVVLGSVMGALIAFMISRKLGRAYFEQKLAAHLPVKLVGSQSTLMLIVFLTRLAPFLSFDVISYAAGMTRLSIWRFLLATILGIIPISFALAHLGSASVAGEVQSIVSALLLLGIITLTGMLFHRHKNKETDRQ